MRTPDVTHYRPIRFSDFYARLARPIADVASMRHATTHGRLRDAIVRAGWRGTVLAMIFTLMLLACSLAYGALFAITDRAWAQSARSFAVATLAGAAVAWLAAHREDLIEA